VSEGHNASFERETLRWFDDVYRFAYSLTRNRADADDLLQETYLRAYRSWHTFIPGSNALCWLFTICRHRHVQEVMRTRRHIDFEDGDVASTLNIHEQAAERDLVALIYGAIDRLPEPYRSTMVLVDVEDQTYAAAATVCRCPVGTIRSRLFRARRLIRGMIAHTVTSATRESRS
jgi:RNA polymerase sigma-70 factor (ECF subfamily)